MKFAVFEMVQWPEGKDRGESFEAEIERLSEAEAQGYDAVWIGEPHFHRYGIAPSVLMCAAQVAARTRRACPHYLKNEDRT